MKVKPFLFIVFIIKSYKLLFVLTLITGTIVSISANTWFTSWLGLEVNLLSIIPLILRKVNKIITEASIKYFLTQAFASTLLIISINLSTYYLSKSVLASIDLLIIFSLLIKTGLPPAHFWFPQVANKILWNQCLILFTWQKIAPLLLLTSFNVKKILIIIFLSVAIGALGGLNQISLKLILTYSSINHSGWILTTSLSNVSLWANYFLIYSFLTSCIIASVSKTKINSIPDLFYSKKPKSSIYCFIFNIISLGGLPPFLGFMAKLPVLIIMLKIKITIIFSAIISASLISLFFYARILYNFIIIKFSKKNNFITPRTPNRILLTICIRANLLAPALISSI